MMKLFLLLTNTLFAAQLTSASFVSTISSKGTSHGRNSYVRNPFSQMKTDSPISKLSASTNMINGHKKPALIVFDLDNTLWTPELYQLRKLQAEYRKQGSNSEVVPIAGKDVKLFEGASKILQSIRNSPEEWKDTKFAVASRTKSGPWAEHLLNQFELTNLFHYIEIFPGDKTKHFLNLKEKSGISFNEMLFFDDSRDGKYGNCVPVGQMGVMSVHCPGGIHSEEIFEMGMKRFAEWTGESNTIVEWDGSVSSLPSKTFDIDNNKRMKGTVKLVNQEKQFGFLTIPGKKDVYFPFRNLPKPYQATKGDKLSFIVSKDPRNKNKLMASSIEVIQSSQNSTESMASDENDDNLVTLRTFSMNLPFAALLANEYKTLETRNGTMFTTYPEGTQMLLHVGQRTYPDGNRHLDVMRSGGLSDKEIEQLKSLPPGFGKGMAVAILEIGKTYETTVEERSDPDFQRKVGAFGEDSGKMVTEIKRIQYLKRGVKVSGKGGVFKVKIDRSVLPDDWM